MRGKVLIPAAVVIVAASGYLWYFKKSTVNDTNSAVHSIATSDYTIGSTLATATPTPTSTSASSASPSPTATTAPESVVPTANVDAAADALLKEGSSISSQGATTESTTDPGAATSVSQSLASE